MPTRAAARRLEQEGIKTEGDTSSNVPGDAPTFHSNEILSPSNHSKPSASRSTPTNFTSAQVAEAANSAEHTVSANGDGVPQLLMSDTQPQKRFKTRAGITRKSHAQREELQKAEDERRQQRLANLPAADETPVVNQGRGGAKGRNVPQRIQNQQALGPLGADPAEPRKERGRRAANATETELIEASEAQLLTVVPDRRTVEDEGQKVGPKTKGKGKGKGKGKAGADSGTRAEEIAYVSSGDEFEGHRRRDIEDIERIDSSSEEGDGLQPQSGRGQTEQPGGRPRIGLRPVRAYKEEHTTRQVGIAADLVDEDLGRYVDREKSVSIEDEIHVDEQVTPEPEHVDRDGKARRRKPRKSSFRDPRLATETIEERRERIRLEADLKVMRQVWRAKPPSQLSHTAFEETSTGNAEPTFDSRDGKVFLMQFPPLTPMLVDSTKLPVHSSPPDRSEKAVSEPKPEIKRESRQVHSKTEPASDTRMLTAAHGHLPSGFAGKLKVHKSGKVTMDWGGTDMLVGLGTEVDFPQDLLLTGPVGENNRAEAFALAQIQEKMVLTPDWEKMHI
ncbi:MAG: hypothetical protein Q9160_002325 [Pyrenula sp. 1 TL-2023]